MDNPHHLIFEGAELVGKSFLMSQIYSILEKKYHSGSGLLDGCHWFNTDIGVFGSPSGPSIVEKFVDIAEILKNKNILFEKLHLSDQVYASMLGDHQPQYHHLESRLADLDFKIIFLKISEDENLIAKRIQDRLNLYPHYQRIVQNPNWYIQQQQKLLKILNTCQLENLIVDTTNLPGNVDQQILEWLGEK